ncbi:Ribosomal RNA small subunit methyltransferase E [Ephemeroptericola cinctiostellae]|uniref:Ribosomal RNA small subunit methyltransferase E n=1 Tax=Ephemeroptericola cinctiostellae TaxID=2268024 RepID=A0A345D7K1_9BURK|nr:16S rRNA (uracil(1498)-N(3))-methyltransferase [Ephemeroptericola cinctiostellae]AXF84339.1 Ribosomal RNA small subunit methyltransferase E [Ephemeroptericola cinctiostellae]
MISRFYLPQPWAALNTPFTLTDDIFRHAITVLRLRVGDTFVVFDGEGQMAQAHLINVEKKSAQAQLTDIEQHSVESNLQITLAQCLSSADKMDWTIEKAVELGVTRIVPLFSARSQIKLSADRADKKVEHWQRIITAACAQSGRNHLPKLSAPMQLNAFLSAEKSIDSHKLMLHPRHAQPLRSLAAPTSTQAVVLLIGPEAGFDDNEFNNAQASHFTPTLLGPRILRTESAGLATIAALQTLWGDF